MPALSEGERTEAIMHTTAKLMGLLILGAVCVAVAAIGLLYYNYQSEAASHRRVMLERGEAVLDAFTGGVRAQGRMGIQRADRLQTMLEEMADSPSIRAARIAAEGESFAEVSSLDGPIPETRPGAPLWREDGLVLARETRAGVGMGPGRGLGRGMGQEPGPGAGRGPGAVEEGFSPAPGPFILTVVLDTVDLEMELARHRRQFLFASGLVGLVSAMGAAALYFWLRRREMVLALLAARERAAHHEQLAQLGAGLAHETKNPLGAVRGFAQTIASAEDASPEARTAAGHIIDEADRTVGHINAFLTLARPLEPELAPVDVDAFYAELQPILETETTGTGAVIVLEPTGLTIDADAQLLRRALLNLVSNAVRACGAGGTVTLGGHGEHGGAALWVADTGSGIAPEDLPRVTEPYFSRAPGGTGLGLAVADRIARNHGARLVVDSAPGQGTRVSLVGFRVVEQQHA